MITLEIRYLGCPQQWKVIDGVHPNLLVANVDHREAAERFIEKYWPECTICAFGQMPTGKKHSIALAYFDEEKREEKRR
jgi:hypothetical protein